jgi:hypothetical protein
MESSLLSADQLMDIAYASYLLANHGAGTGRGARLDLLTPEASTSGSGGDAYVDRPALPLVMHGVHASGAAPMHSVAHPALDIAPIHAASLLLQRGVRTLPIGWLTRPRPLVDRLLLWMSRRPSLRQHQPRYPTSARQVLLSLHHPQLNLHLLTRLQHHLH